MRLRIVAALSSAAALALAPSALAHAPNVRGPIQGKHGRVTSTSSNWSGYDVTGGGATHVTGTWVQPTVQSCDRRENSWSSPWVGIDGDTSNTVEQVGTDSDCSHGVPTYYAWWEMYPKGVVTISAIAWLFLKLASESELKQRLIEEGHDPALASRAVRYGRGEELASR